MITGPLNHQELLIQQYSIVLNNHMAFETSRTIDVAVQHRVPNKLKICATNS
jgi:hypothetical protein